MLTADKLRQLLSYDEETGVFTWNTAAANSIKIGDIAGSNAAEGYLIIQIEGQRHFAHRLAWLHQTGSWPKDMIDHINGIKNDNRFSNLREATCSENLRNASKKKNNKSGFKGVSWHRHAKRWRAAIRIDGERKYLGYFDTPESAHAAYAAAAEKRQFR